MTLQSKVITVDKPGGLLNMNDRPSLREKMGGHATWRDASFWWSKQHRLSCRGAIGPVEVWVTFGTKRPNQRRDPHNYFPTIKAILDGMTNACVWEDDDSKHVKTYEPVFSGDLPANKLQIMLAWETADVA